jgi:hypothetical protein
MSADGASTAKGKSADFLIKNSLSNNAALIEIRKPHTPLVK